MRDLVCNTRVSAAELTRYCEPTGFNDDLASNVCGVPAAVASLTESVEVYDYLGRRALDALSSWPSPRVLAPAAARPRRALGFGSPRSRERSAARGTRDERWSASPLCRP